VLAGDPVFLEVAEGLDHQPGSRPGGCHVPWGGAPKLDARLADLHRLLGAVGEVDDLGRHLLGEPQEVHCVGPRRLETAVVLLGEAWAMASGLGLRRPSFGCFSG
jgi:hypothetical protein